jgi:hypothetical protein
MSITRRFVESIEWTLAHEILQMARNIPHHLIIYDFEIGPNAVPLVCVSKYESDLTDSQYKVRVYDADLQWDYVTPIFTSRNQVASYVASHLPHEPSRHYGLGCKMFKGAVPPGNPVSRYFPEDRSIAIDWLFESQTMFADYMDEIGDPMADSEDSRGEWVEDEDHFDELLQDQINFLIAIHF